VASEPRWDAELEAAVAAARAGGRAALAFFGQTSTVDWKADDSPVGEADRAADTAIRTHLRSACPDDAILTEESGAEAGRSGRRWIVDPVDGTRDFLRGVPNWANLIALEADGDIVVGVLHLAALGRLYAAARGGGAWRDGARLRVPEGAAVSRCVLVHGEPDCLLEALDVHAFARLARGVGMMRGHGAPYGAALYLDGQADAWTEGNVSLWDIAPFVVLLEEAGACFTDLAGRRGWPYRSGLAAAPALHAALLGLAHGNGARPAPGGGSARE
jgi:histidinol phosphatase-like enzyme (inositol monophosphatase family)